MGKEIKERKGEQESISEKGVKTLQSVAAFHCKPE